MLDGLEATEIKLSELERTRRIDSEFFLKENLVIAKRISELKSIPIAQAASVSDGNHFEISSRFQDKGIPYYRGQDVVSNFFIEQSDAICIDENTFWEPHLLRSHLKREDVLLSIVGTIGAVSLVSEDKPATCSCKLAILRPNVINGSYLGAFLLSKYGSNQVKKFVRGAVQTGLILEDFDQIHIPLPSRNFSSRIQSIIRTAHKRSEQARMSYSEAESLVLSQLGLKDLKLPEHNVDVKPFSQSFASTGRLDAEYYQPKYQSVLSILGRSGKRVGDVAGLARERFNPRGLIAFDYIEIGNLAENGLAEAERVPIEETPSRAQWIVRPNDVITSTVRPIRRLSALIEQDQDGFVCSSGFAVLRPKRIDPEVLLVFLRTPIISEILDLHTTASMYPAISTEDLLKIPIVLPSAKLCSEIVRRVRSSRNENRESKRLLQVAKHAVEIAIEQNEATALEFIEASG